MSRYFGASEEQVMGYIVQYNNCGLKCEGSDDIGSERSENRHFGTNRKRICDFLLAINSNLGPLLHRSGDTAAYWSKSLQKSPVRTHHSLINRPHSGWPLMNFGISRIFPETRMFGLSDGEETMTLAFFVLIQYRSVTDRQTDRDSSSGYEWMNEW